MKKKGPRKRRAKCTKVCFPSYGAAAWTVRQTGIGLVRVYRCGQHHRETWHTTSKA